MPLLLYDNGLVGHGGNVSASSCAGTHDNGDLWNAGAGHASLIVEDAAKMVPIWEDISLVGEVGTTAVDHVDTRKVVLLSNCLSSEMLLDGDGVVCSALDCAVVGDNDAGDALDNAYTGDDTSSWDVGLWVKFVASQWTKLEEGGSRINECCDTITGQHFVASEMLLPSLV